MGMCTNSHFLFIFKTVIVRDKDNMKQDVLRQKRIHDRQYEFDMVLGEDANQVQWLQY